MYFSATLLQQHFFSLVKKLHKKNCGCITTTFRSNLQVRHKGKVDGEMLVAMSPVLRHSKHNDTNNHNDKHHDEGDESSNATAQSKPVHQLGHLSLVFLRRISQSEALQRSERKAQHKTFACRQ